MRRVLTGLAAFLFVVHAAVAPFAVFCFAPGPNGSVRVTFSGGLCCQGVEGIFSCVSHDHGHDEENYGLSFVASPSCDGCEDVPLWSPALPEGVSLPCHDGTASSLFLPADPYGAPESPRASAAEFRPVRDGPPLYLNHCRLSL